MQDLVSIIIPNYNHEKYLKERIESVLNQTYDNIEVIILDDYSTDKSLSIIELYKNNPKISKIIYSNENSGSTFKQWQKGVSIANGEWVWIAESDDFCSYDLLETLLDDRINKNCGVRFCASNNVDENNIIKNNPKPSISGGEYSGIYFLKNFQIKDNTIPNASAVLFKKTFLQNALTEEITKYKLMGDHFTYVKMILKTDIYFCKDVKNFHREHSNSVRFNLSKNGIHYLEEEVFRMDMHKLFFSIEDSETRNDLIRVNKNAHYYDKGAQAIFYIQNKKYLKSIIPLMKATFKPMFNIYYIRSALYWLLKSTK